MTRCTTLLALLALVAAGAGLGWWARGAGVAIAPPADAGARPESVGGLPAFVEPGPGARAPTSEAMGLQLGVSTLADAERWAADRGLRCRDTSIRALMEGLRARRRKELEAALAEGRAVDGITGASILRGATRHEANPQVRLSCEGAPSSATISGGRRREPSRGRVLLIFDSPAHPLRHISYQRRHTDHGAAIRDLKADLAWYTGRYGPPSMSSGTVPVLAFPKLHPVLREWVYADLKVRLNALYLGRQTVSLSETIEVPWPVRADAPAR